MRGLWCDRQQSILPGRFQPSTFDAWELNCCVRDGNRWGLPAIVTGSLDGLFRLLPRQPAARSVDIRQYHLPSLALSSLHKTGKSSSICFRSFQTLKTLQKKLLPKKLTCLALLSNQALDGLVPVRSIHCCTYTPGLSTLSSSRRLTDFRHERSHLGVGFTLRCFQRLSDPDVATQRYAWRHNWYTIGPSTPVLSY